LVRIDPDPGKRELGHVGAADEDGAGSAQPADDCRVALCRRPVVERPRSCQRGLAGDIEQVLDRHRQSGKR